MGYLSIFSILYIFDFCMLLMITAVYCVLYLTECKTMSKLGLGRAKLASSVSSAFGPPPPDKKRKTNESVTAESAWDDDLDIILTQNMNKLDSLVAATQSAVPSGCDEFANNYNDRSCHSSPVTSHIVCNQEAEGMCSDAGEKTIPLTGRRLIGHGSSHSRSADCLNNSPSNSLVQMQRKSSFSMEKSRTKSKESDELQLLTSFQVNKEVWFSTNGTGTLHNFQTVDAVQATASPMHLDANANCTEIKLTQIAKECECYKAEVYMLFATFYCYAFAV